MKPALDILSKLEENLVSKEFFSLNEGVTNDTHLNQVAYNVHTHIVNSLIFQYLLDFCPELDRATYNQLFSYSFATNPFALESIETTEIPSICEMLHIEYLNSRFIFNRGKIYRKKSKENIIEKGAVYTQEHIVKEIVWRTLGRLESDYLKSAHILDFASGTGRFYREIAKFLNISYGIDVDFSIKNIIYGIDIDSIAVNICRLQAFSMLTKKDIVALQTISKHIICKNALIREIAFDDNAITNEDCDGLFFCGFDAIVSNPPYLVLKPNKRKMDNVAVEYINNLAKHFRNSAFYNYSIEGMLNLYQLSLEAMLSMLKVNGEMGIICPSTLFADVSSGKLRKHLLRKNDIYYIKYFSEDDSLFENVTQATCIFHLTKGKPTTNITILKEGKSFEISIEDVKKVFSANWEIPPIERTEWDILKKLQVIPPMKEREFIRNKRGELDLSLNKEYITVMQTDYRLVRGNMITEAVIKDINHEYVKPDFLKIKSADYLINDQGRKRIVCQQISNQGQNVRLKFVECQKNDILGNSCNYITVEENLIPKMKVILNSALLNWRFKITSTNNHINNYELDELPIIDLELITDDDLDLDAVKRDERICSLYGLSSSEVKYIIGKYYDTI